MRRLLLALALVLAPAIALAQAIITPPAAGGCTTANPSATIGLSAINGTATTCMTSDSAPPLSQSIAPTWTGQHTWATGTIASSTPAQTVTQTWNSSGTSFLAQTFNITDTASASGSGFVDYQVGGTSKVHIGSKDGDGNRSNISFANTTTGIGIDTSGSSHLLIMGSLNAATVSVADAGASGVGESFRVGASYPLGFTSGNVFQNLDTMLTRKTAANLQLGNADAAAPVAQTVSAQSVVTGTSNTNGTLWKFQDSAGTGTGTSGGFEFDTHPAGSSSSTPNAAVAALTIPSSGQIQFTTALVAKGSAPTLTGTGTFGTQTGGNTAGTFVATMTAQTVIITFSTTAPNGWTCNFHDQSTPADTINQTASSTTSCTGTGTTIASDVIGFSAVAY